MSELANAFSKVLHEWLGDEKIAEINERNTKDDDFKGCQSHDFCDANMAMLEAYETVFGDSNPFSDTATRKVNEAWKLAKNNKFQQL